MFKGFYPLLEKFLCIYLPKQRGCSSHTAMSYYAAICQYVSWLADTHNIDKNKMQVFDFTKERVLSWLSSIEDNGASVATRNQRLAGTRSFLSFASEEEPVYMETCLSVGKIKTKKGCKPSKDFLNHEEFQAILEAIPFGTDTAVRHYALLSVLYDSAARIQEICHMKLEDISFGKNCSIKIYGKGRKTRIVYISADAAALIKDYCRKFGISEGLLFNNRYGNQITDSGIDYIIKKYAAIAAENLPSLKAKKVSAHTFRRSKATHMLLSGVSLPVIQRFLGHESIQTTEEYLEIGSEAMIQAVKRTGASVLPPEKTQESEKWKEADVMERIRLKMHQAQG
jgi:site-specific recombinase XerD